MKFGFFLKGKLVDSCRAETASAAKTDVEYDEVHPILDTDQLSAGILNTDSLTVSGTKEIPVLLSDSILTPEEGRSLARAATMSRSILPDGTQNIKQNKVLAEPKEDKKYHGQR